MLEEVEVKSVLVFNFLSFDYLAVIIPFYFLGSIILKI